MHELAWPTWTLLPFPMLVLAIAVLPMTAAHLWEKPVFQAICVSLCAVPVTGYALLNGHAEQVMHAGAGYVSFVVTLTALYVTSGGICLRGDLTATPRTNALFLIVGALLASLIGTTGASMLLIRPLLRTNEQREHRAHLVPFFILVVANAGGLLTPLGDPPLLVGYIMGVPFFWTLRLFPIWLAYVAFFVAAFYVLDRRAYARESRAALARDVAEQVPLSLWGKRNITWMLLVIPAALLPAGVREATLIGITVGSWLLTPREIHTVNGYSWAPMRDIALIFAGLFLCLGPLEVTLAHEAPHLPIRAAWQLFWASGVLSSVLDNAPTYTAFAALARGLGSSHEVVAGIDPVKLAAISAGSVVMGATTYIGNGPNLMVKAVAESGRYAMPSFTRYFAFAFATMLPVHAVVTLALWLLER